MFQPNELVMLFLGLAVLIFVVKNRATIKRYPYSALLLLSFYCSVIGWLCTVVETCFLNTYLNFLEHAGYLISAFLFMAWVWALATKDGEIQ